MKNILVAIALISLVSCQQNANSTAKASENTVEKAPEKAPETTPAAPAALLAEANSPRCFGTEPFWDVTILEAKGTIVYRHIGEGVTISFPFSAPKIEGDKWTYTTKDGKNSLTAVMTKGKCSDGMSDTEHSYSSEITFNGQKLKGCGFR